MVHTMLIEKYFFKEHLKTPSLKSIFHLHSYIQILEHQKNTLPPLCIFVSWNPFMQPSLRNTAIKHSNMYEHATVPESDWWHFSCTAAFMFCYFKVCYLRCYLMCNKHVLLVTKTSVQLVKQFYHILHDPVIN